MTGAEILIRLQRIEKALALNNLTTVGLEFKVVREEWSDIVRTLSYYGSNIGFDTRSICYLGITIRNPEQ